MKKLVIIGTVFPEPQSTAAGTRMLQLITLFQEMQYEISFLSTANKSDFSFDLESIRVSTFQITLNDASFDDLLKSLKPEMVLFDRYITEEQFGWRVAEVCPDALTILDTEDLHFLRKARETSFKNATVLKESELITDFFKREMAAILRCDLSLLISDVEWALLKDNYKINPSILYYLPLFAEPQPSKIPFAERNHFVSIGNFLHEPNWQTVLALKTLWPLIKFQLPKAELHLYGAYMPEKARQLHNAKEGFLLKGRAASVQECFEKARVLLAPIPFGAGIKGKLLEGMQYGLPSVTSTIGAEAMCGDLPWNGAITDEPGEFASKAVALHSEEHLWISAQNNGYEIIKNRFSKSLFAKDFKWKIESLLLKREEHRQENYLGQILQHHTLQSSKYMSKWITEKNKR